MKFWTYCIFSVLLVGLSACSTSTLFTSYPDKMGPNLSAIKQGQYQTSIASLSIEQKSNDYELYAAELGRTEQLAFNYAKSSATYLPLISTVEADQLQAKIQGRKVLVNSASLLSNDNLIPYKLAAYEIIYLYQYQALNFIAQGDLQNALVAARKANDLQGFLASQYQQELAAAQDLAQKNNFDQKLIDHTHAELNARLTALADVKNAFQNAMSYYLSGILFLASGDNNDAAVAFQQAIEIMPQNTYLQTMLLNTMQNQGGSTSKLQNYQQAFGLKTLPTPPQNKALVTVMYEQNFVAEKVPVTLPIYLPKLQQVQTISFPTYPKTTPAITPLHVSIVDNDSTRMLSDTELMLNTNALAAKDLMQNYPIIFVREALRVMTKAGITAAISKGANNDNDDDRGNSGAAIAAIILQAYSIFSDRPDLRSWLTLPQDIQIAQYSISPGTYQVNLSNNNLTLSLPLTLAANRYYLIWVTQYGKEMKAQAFPL